MILPRSWVPKVPVFDYGNMQINQAIQASKPIPSINVGRLFYHQKNTTRRQNAYKGTGTRMAMKFAKGAL